jgi:hypothetical protein
MEIITLRIFMKDKTYQAFNLHSQEVESLVENRRKSYALRFTISSLVTFLVAVLSPASIYLLTIEEDTFNFLILVYLFIIISLARITFLQLIRYKATVKSRSHERLKITKDSILKDIIFTELLKFFGDFKFKSKNKISLNDVLPSGIIPDSDNYSGEDLISGIIHESKIEICEAKLTNLVAGEPVDFFTGLLVVIDICNPDIKLRGGLAGHSVLIADQHKYEDILQGRFSKLNRIKLADANLEGEFEFFSDNENEAKRILPVEILEEVKELSNYINNAKGQQEHIENKLMYGVEQVVFSLSNTLKSCLSRLTGREKEDLYIRDFNQVYDPTKHNIISNEVNSINNCLQISAYKDKLVITLPYRHDLFEPNSLFSKPIIEEDKQILFRIMNLVDKITSNLTQPK